MTPRESLLRTGTVRMASLSDVGLVRSANEDSCGHFERADGALLLVVADGMGGHRGGATASRTSVATIGEHFEQGADRPPELLRRAIEAANVRVHLLAHEDPALAGMGTTVVAFLLTPGLEGFVAHVGDSRAYRVRGGHLEPLTTDHSVVAEMLRRGLISPEEAASHPRRNEILRSVGVLPGVEVETSSVVVEPGDRFLLCSDGLSGVLRDEEIAEVVRDEAPESAVETLIRLANECGGPDNITVQLLQIAPDARPATEAFRAGAAREGRRRDGGRAWRPVRGRLGVVLALAALAAGIFVAWRLASAASPEQIPPSPAAAWLKPIPPSPAAGRPPRPGLPLRRDAPTPDSPQRPCAPRAPPA